LDAASSSRCSAAKQATTSIPTVLAMTLVAHSAVRGGTRGPRGDFYRSLYSNNPDAPGTFKVCADGTIGILGPPAGAAPRVTGSHAHCDRPAHTISRLCEFEVPAPRVRRRAPLRLGNGNAATSWPHWFLTRTSVLALGGAHLFCGTLTRIGRHPFLLLDFFSCLLFNCLAFGHVAPDPKRNCRMRVVETPHPMRQRGCGGGRSAADGANRRPAGGPG
jgi:hypothetical protein